MSDVIKKCKECNIDFTISEPEQKWYKDQGFKLPERCPACRKSRRNNRVKK